METLHSAKRFAWAVAALLVLSSLPIHACLSEACTCCESVPIVEADSCCPSSPEPAAPQNNASPHGDCCLILDLDIDPVITAPALVLAAPAVVTSLEYFFVEPDSPRVPSTTGLYGDRFPGDPPIHVLNCQFLL